MSVFTIAAMKPEEVKVETAADETECFKKTMYFMQNYVDPEYYRGSYLDIG